MNKKIKIVLDSDEVSDLADRIATLLGETEERAILSIRAVIGVAGSEFALQCLVSAAKLKRDGLTMKTDDGEKHRTLGGVFFKLAKDKFSSSQRYRYMSITNPIEKENSNGK